MSWGMPCSIEKTSNFFEIESPPLIHKKPWFCALVAFLQMLQIPWTSQSIFFWISSCKPTPSLRNHQGSTLYFAPLPNTFFMGPQIPECTISKGFMLVFPHHCSTSPQMCFTLSNTSIHIFYNLREILNHPNHSNNLLHLKWLVLYLKYTFQHSNHLKHSLWFSWTKWWAYLSSECFNTQMIKSNYFKLQMNHLIFKHCGSTPIHSK